MTMSASDIDSLYVVGTLMTVVGSDRLCLYVTAEIIVNTPIAEVPYFSSLAEFPS